MANILVITYPETEGRGTDHNKTKYYLFYLYGLIVEEAGVCVKSEEHEYYE